MASSGQPRQPNPMVGSIHKYSDGYGYGARCPTERNKMTVPASIPQFRHPPAPEAFHKGTRSSQLIASDDRSKRRNAQQIMYQTSGEIGSHYYNLPTEFMRLARQPIPSAASSSSERIAAATAMPSSREESVAASGSARSSYSGALSPSPRDTSRSQQVEFHGSSHRAAPSAEVLAHTLRNLDRSFQTTSRNDLLAAVTSQAKQASWSATTNYQSYLNSKQWMNRLRQDNS